MSIPARMVALVATGLLVLVAYMLPWQLTTGILIAAGLAMVVGKILDMLS